MRINTDPNLRERKRESHCTD